MQPFMVRRDGAADLRFIGEEISSVTSSPDKASSDFSGSTGRWTVLTLYRTQAGKFVCEQVGMTQWQGEYERCSAAVCATEAEVIEFFGYGWLAKALYADAGIEAAETID